MLSKLLRIERRIFSILTIVLTILILDPKLHSILEIFISNDRIYLIVRSIWIFCLAGIIFNSVSKYFSLSGIDDPGMRYVVDGYLKEVLDTDNDEELDHNVDDTWNLKIQRIKSDSGIYKVILKDNNNITWMEFAALTPKDGCIVVFKSLYKMGLI